MHLKITIQKRSIDTFLRYVLFFEISYETLNVAFDPKVS